MGIVVNEERRTDKRLRVRGAAHATLRPGCEVSVIDLSPGGALVDAHRPLRSGARVHVRLTTNGRVFTLSAHVLRCLVWPLNDGEDGVVYRGALQFEHPCLSFREADARTDHGTRGQDLGEER